jgi:transposase
MQRNDLSRSFVAFEQNTTLVVVVELSLNKWLVGGLVPGLSKEPLKSLAPDQDALLDLINRWRHEGTKGGGKINRVVLTYEAGRDGFWLARWLLARGIEVYVIHPTSIPVSREHRRAKSDRLDTQLLMRATLGWLRGERKHCQMVQIPRVEEEDAREPHREQETLVSERTRVVNRIDSILVRHGIRGFNPRRLKAEARLEKLCPPDGGSLPPNTLAELRRMMAVLRVLSDLIKAIKKTREQRLKKAPCEGTHPMVLMLAKITGIGIETADMLVHEILSRNLRDDRAVGRYAGLTGSPYESGDKRREKGMAKAGNARVRRGMVLLAWRWVRFQKDSALTQWFVQRTVSSPKNVRKTMIVALARKLLIALWRYVTTGEDVTGVKLRAA